MQASSLLAGVGLAKPLAFSGAASAQNPVPLSSYADANGYIDVQALTCAQLAGTFQEDADALTAWYSGWYNGLAKKHVMDFKNGKQAEHEVIVYCKANASEDHQGDRHGFRQDAKGARNRPLQVRGD